MFKNFFKNLLTNVQANVNAVKSAVQRALTLPKKQRDGVDKTLHLTPGTTESVGNEAAGVAATLATNELEHLAEQEARKL